MLYELAKDPYTAYSKQTELKNRQTLNYLRFKINRNDTILDVGVRSPLTDEIEKFFNIMIYNTDGDLDTNPNVPMEYFDIIIYSHTIEHQFNPLFTLLRLKSRLKHNGIMYIFLPNRPKFLWFKGHFHEIDRYRMGLLLKRAGFKILSITKQRIKRPWYAYIGIRPLIRLFCEFNMIYEITHL